MTRGIEKILHCGHSKLQDLVEKTWELHWQESEGWPQFQCCHWEVLWKVRSLSQPCFLHSPSMPHFRTSHWAHISAWYWIRAQRFNIQQLEFKSWFDHIVVVRLWAFLLLLILIGKEEHNPSSSRYIWNKHIYYTLRSLKVFRNFFYQRENIHEIRER